MQEIVELVWEQTEENDTTYPSDVLTDYINRALDDLTPVAKMLNCVSGISLDITDGKAVISILGNPSLSAAHEFLNVYFTPAGGAEERLRRLPVGDTVSRGWVLTAQEIQLRNLGADSGTARVEYYRKLSHVAKPEDTPELPDQYHNLLVLYSCARVQEREAATELKRDFANEYVAAKQLFALQRIWDMEPQHRNIIRQARVLGLLGVKSGR